VRQYAEECLPNTGCLPQGCVKGKAACNCQRGALVRFKRNLLREHYIAWNKMPSRHEAPSHQRSAMVIEFVDVDRRTVENAVMLSGIAADDLKTFLGLKLSALIDRQPLAQQGDTASFSGVLRRPFPISLAHLSQ
jgi:hypothetical protein